MKNKNIRAYFYLSIILFLWGAHGVFQSLIESAPFNLITIFHMAGILGIVQIIKNTRWLNGLLGTTWICNGLFSLLALFGLFISFMNPVSTMEIKLLSFSVFTLDGLDYIAAYFIARCLVFITLGFVLFGYPREISIINKITKTQQIVADNVG